MEKNKNTWHKKPENLTGMKLKFSREKPNTGDMREKCR